MAKFNSKGISRSKTENKAGGEAFIQSPELEFASLLITSFAEDKHYESAGDQLKRLRKLIAQLPDKKFAAKAAILARNEFQLRSITHVVAGEICSKISGEPWLKEFYDRVVVRVDDITEILSYYLNTHGKETVNAKGKKVKRSIPAAMKKGLAKSFDKFNEYQIAKYRGEKNDLSLVDAVNLVRPKPVDNNRDALNKLIAGTLRSTGTWEAKLTTAGQIATSAEEKEELKATAWKELVNSKSIGYMALLRNLRNIAEQAPEVLDAALVLLKDKDRIKKSRLLPFRFATAKEQFDNSDVVGASDIIQALNVACDIACENVPKFDGKTLVVLDKSGSMHGYDDSKSPAKIGSLFTAVLAKANNADVILFSDDASYKTINPSDSTLTIADSLKFSCGGTDFHSIFKRANKAYDRVIILSDMQGWVGYHTPTATFDAYCKRYNCKPKVYSFDLAGYGSMEFPQEDVYCVAGFSEKVLDVMVMLEQDKNALVNRINAVKL